MVNRVKANSITITVDGDDFTADLSSIMLQSEEASNDTTTFADASVGGASDWYVELAGVTSTDTTSFWMTCWNNPGVEVPFTLEVGSPTAGEFAGTLRLPAKGRVGFGGEASSDGTFNFSAQRFEVVGVPTWTLAV